MPIIRKIIQVGTSRAISLPKSWLELIERESGRPIKEVSMEINGTLIIHPILPKQDFLASNRKKGEELYDDGKARALQESLSKDQPTAESSTVPKGANNRPTAR
jgi:antitoxin component of MazEF toxin-antitoxin module